jgi:hypothetical protein
MLTDATPDPAYRVDAAIVFRDATLGEAKISAEDAAKIARYINAIKHVHSRGESRLCWLH